MCACAPQAIPRLGIPWLSLQDGPQGFRDGKYGKGSYGNGTYLGTSTQWPSGLTIGATWDRTIASLWGQSMGAEFKAKGANGQLGPGLNVARIPQVLALLTVVNDDGLTLTLTRIAGRAEL